MFEFPKRGHSKSWISMVSVLIFLFTQNHPHIDTNIYKEFQKLDTNDTEIVTEFILFKIEPYDKFLKLFRDFWDPLNSIYICIRINIEVYRSAIAHTRRREKRSFSIGHKTSLCTSTYKIHRISRSISSLILETEVCRSFSLFSARTRRVKCRILVDTNDVRNGEEDKGFPFDMELN